MQERAWRADFQVSDDEGRIISGIAVPYDSPTTIAERGMVFDETFVRGAFRETVGKRENRVRILGHHDARSMPLGKTVKLDEQTRGLYLEARISDTRDGNDALTLVRDGALDGFSVGFSVPSGGDTWNAGQTARQITNAHLHEVSLVNFPAYDRARVESVRAMGDSNAGAIVPAHQFDDHGGTGVCVVCGMTEDDGSHTSDYAADLDLTVRYELERARLQLLRLQYI
jgi:Escherichia/Staphylococcus phage prohead protease